MIPKSLSASAAATFEGCAARWEAEYFLRGAQESGSAASLGTVVHGALEDFVSGGHHLNGNDLDVLLGFYTTHYETNFADRSRYDEGVEMLTKWHARQDWSGRSVLSCEVKTNFMLKTSVGEIPFNYIWDRCDLLEAPGDETVIEVVDYKSWMRPVGPADLRDKIQARCYGLAANIAYPKADKIWVTFDQLRHDAVGIVFTREENVATYRYLQRLAERIIATPQPAPETLNPECNWCIRKTSCSAVASNALVGGIHAIGNASEAGKRRHLLENQKKAIDNAIRELDGVIFDEFERDGIPELEVEGLTIGITATRKRAIDAQRVADVCGPEIVARYGSLTISAVDSILKDDATPDDLKQKLRTLITYKISDPRVYTKAANPIDGD